MPDGRFDRADDRRFERRVAFLEIHRDLRVGDPAAQRPDEAIEEQRDEYRDDDDAEGDDCRGAEAERLEPGRRQQERQHGAGHHDDRAPQGEPEAPAVSHLTNDVDQLRAWIHVRRFSLEQAGQDLRSPEDLQELFLARQVV